MCLCAGAVKSAALLLASANAGGSVYFLLNIAMITVLNRPHELKLHIRSAFTNGVTKEEIKEVLLQTAGSGVPLGINVESLSIFKEEIDGAHELFQKLQVRIIVFLTLGEMC